MAAKKKKRPSKTRRKKPAKRTPFDLGTLNRPQLDAVLHDDGPLLVLAGAGSGKTRAIIYRIVRLIRDGVPASEILGVTFTNKAAREMRERLESLCGRDGAEVRLSTFHSLALSILREEHRAAGLRPHFCIYDTGDQLSLVRELCRQVQLADRRLDIARLLEIILRTKRERLENVSLIEEDDYTLGAYELYPRYIAQMRAFNAVDFDDLILRAQDVLDRPAVKKRWQERFRYVLVDEYQDTSPDQLALLKALSDKHQNVCVVGDDDQSIYAWRGAAADNILAFGKQFPGAREVVLDQNYRSTGNILDAANAVIRNNLQRKPKDLWSAGGKGKPVDIVACAGGDDEATFVVDTIGKLLYDGVPHDNIAVLYRANVQSRIFEESLALERVPFRVVGGQAFFERKEVRDAVAYLSVVNNPLDEVALRRIVNTPPRGIGLTSLERLVEHGEKSGKGLWAVLCAAKSVSGLSDSAVGGAAALCKLVRDAQRRLDKAKPGELAPGAKELFDQIGMRDAILGADDSIGIAERRLENLDEVLRSITQFERMTSANGNLLNEYLRSAALAGNDEEEEDQRGRVTLMTLHSAKGLEFDYVFLVGIEEDSLPHKKTLEAEGDLSEERRLCYVGMTRAKKRLWLTWARQRKRYGTMVDRAASRFLAELPEGEGVRRLSRDEPDVEAESDRMAQDFFARMRAQLEIE